MMKMDDKLIAFAKEVIRASWDGCEYGGDIQDAAVKHGLIRQVSYDPAVHGSNDVDAVPGDPWFVFNGPLA
jgi:hypothetical protein